MHVHHLYHLPTNLYSNLGCSPTTSEQRDCCSSSNLGHHHRCQRVHYLLPNSYGHQPWYMIFLANNLRPPTNFLAGNHTWSVTSATTLTISECPCTLTKTQTPTWSTETISYLTTYCPQPTVVTISSKTYSLSSGTQTIPIVPVTPTSPVAIGTISPTQTPVGPSSSTTGPLQVTGAAYRFEAGAGAMAAAGLAALLL